MATDVSLTYSVVFGKGDGSDVMEYEYSVSGELEKKYLRAKMLRLDPNEVESLEDILSEAYDDIEDEVISDLSDADDPVILEAKGECPMEYSDMVELLDNRDPKALEYFLIDDASEEELQEMENNNWENLDLDDLPYVCDFYEDFEPDLDSIPYNIYVEFEDLTELDLYEDEARETILTLLKEANGDYTVLDDFLDRCDYNYQDGDLYDLAAEVAEEYGFEEFNARE